MDGESLLVTDNAVPRPEKVTLGYCPEQDRIRLDALTDTGETLRLWLTNRILVRLVRHLSGTASDRVVGRSQDSDVKEPESKTDHNDVTRVTLNPNSLEKLVAAIDVRAHHRYFELTFRDETGREAAIFTLSDADLWLWMRGFSNCFQNAGWPLLPLGRAASLQSAPQEFSSRTFH